MFDTIVCGIDGSDHSDNALKLACEIAKTHGSSVHLVHTPQPHLATFPVGAVAGYAALATLPSKEEIDAATKKVTNAALEIAKHADVEIAEVHSDMGDPADRIIACAKDTDADLIVTGRRGLGGVGTVMLGSTTQRVNHLADCACLSVL